MPGTRLDCGLDGVEVVDRGDGGDIINICGVAQKSAGRRPEAGRNWPVAFFACAITSSIKFSGLEAAPRSGRIKAWRSASNGPCFAVQLWDEVDFGVRQETYIAMNHRRWKLIKKTRRKP